MKHYFLSRPRRFGKSLFLDTLKELFEGNEPLFRGLYVHDRWDWTTAYPVIRFSFGGGVLQSLKDLREALHQQLDDQERRHALPARYPDLRSRFHDLIVRRREQTGQRVVVLVDEYDKPILDNLTDRETALAMRDGLRDIYSVIKDSDACIRFAFLTGVSKFSKVSLFSGLNNLLDITVSSPYSAICGYTEADVDTVFAPELAGLDRNDLRRWYNGYNWTGEAVYNPFDLLLLFSERQFRPWWFETGTPSFLVVTVHTPHPSPPPQGGREFCGTTGYWPPLPSREEVGGRGSERLLLVQLLAERGFFTPNLARLRTGMELLSTFDVEHIATEALLFQTGYLTIHQVEEPIRGYWIYTLGYPNQEVESSLNASLLTVYTHDPSQSFAHRLRLLEVLLAHDLMGLKDLFQAFFATIPHQWYDNNPIGQYEGYYASVFYSYFAALGLEIILEDATNHGRIDMTVKFNGRIYLFEFKVVELVPDGRALQQLQQKGYAEKYRALGQPIHLIGVEFSRVGRNIVGFEIGEA